MLKYITKTTKLGFILKETCSNEGWGFPLQKFDKVHVAFLSIESCACLLNWDSRGNMAPKLKTKSRHFGESPATFPNAQTACFSEGKHKNKKSQQEFLWQQSDDS